MSFINFGRVLGRLAVTSATPTGKAYLGGLMYRPEDQSLYIEPFAFPNHWTNGLPMRGDLLCLTTSGGLPTRYVNGLPLNAAGQLVGVQAGLVASYNGGWPISPGGGIAVLDWGSGTPSAPLAFNFTAATVAAGTVHLTWTASTNAVAYEILRDGVQIAVLAAIITPLEYFDTPPGPGTYEYAITAQNRAGQQGSTPPTRNATVA